MLPAPPPNAILAHVGSITLYWYGVILMVATLAGLLLGAWLWRRREGRTGRGLDQFLDLASWVLIAGFVGARLYHVLNELPRYLETPADVVAVWQGGLAIHGGLVGGGLALLWFVRRHRLDLGRVADTVVPAVALGQAIGRLGNYVNQELFGRPTTLPWALPIDAAHRPDAFANATTFHPTFLYESLGDLLLAAALTAWLTRSDPRPGTVTLTYLVASATIRALTELLRIDAVPTLGPVRLPLLVSATIALAAGYALITRTHHARPPRTS